MLAFSTIEKEREERNLDDFDFSSLSELRMKETSDVGFFSKYQLEKSIGVGYAAQVYEASEQDEESKGATPTNEESLPKRGLVVKVCSLTEEEM